MFKKYVFTIIIALLFVQIPAFCEEKIDLPQINQIEIEQDLEDLTNYADEESIKTTPMTGEIDSKVKKSPYENNFQEQMPEQNEFTRAVFMFLKTMLGVLICSVIIFLLLLGVRKFYGNAAQNTMSDKKIEDNLKSTQSESEALQIFFSKTKNL